MTKEKQIEEMARAICRTPNCKMIVCADLKENNTQPCDKRCRAYIYAARFYNTGYRKASDIIEELEKLLLNNHIESFKNYHNEWVYRFKENMLAKFTELKKKYTESE